MILSVINEFKRRNIVVDNYFWYWIYITRDLIRIHIPAGYTVESLPAPVSQDTEWGTFTASAKEEDGAVTVLHEFRAKPFRESPDSYDRFRTFVRAVNKAYSANVVLVKE